MLHPFTSERSKESQPLGGRSYCYYQYEVHVFSRNERTRQQSKQGFDDERYGGEKSWLAGATTVARRKKSDSQQRGRLCIVA